MMNKIAWLLLGIELGFIEVEVARALCPTIEEVDLENARVVAESARKPISLTQPGVYV